MTRRKSKQGWGRSSGFPPYVPVAERRAQAASVARAAKKRGEGFDPVVIEGRTIARTHWGKAFAEHLENHCDWYSRLDRGRTYVRNGSVVHLAVASGRVDAKVMGSALYDVTVDVTALPDARWRRIEANARGRVVSLLDLLAGRLPDELMRELANPDGGLFPRPKEMSFRCSCPDYATMCKHIAAVLYGVAARADERPELLFTLRGVDARRLISSASVDAVVASTTHANELGGDEDLGALFGIELETSAPTATRKAASGTAKRTAPTKSAKKPTKKPAKKPTKTAPRAASSLSTAAPAPAPKKRRRTRAIARDD